MTLLTLEAFAAALRDACAPKGGRKAAVTVATHISPDPDAIGSAFAAAALCRSQGAEAIVYLPEPLPAKYLPLVGAAPWTSDLQQLPRDLLFVVDTATRKRVGPALDAAFNEFGRRLNLDHHVSNEGWADENCVDGSAAACAGLVLKLFQLLNSQVGHPLDAATANLLYAGVLDDTGSFCFSNVNPEALGWAADLVRAGAVAEEVANALYFSVPERIFRLQALALSNLQLWMGGKVSFLVVSKEMLDSTGCGPEDTEGLVDFARRVEGASIAFFLRELEGQWKISLRAKTPDLDVNEIAAVFGGGGHRAAAGATLTGTREEVEREVRRVLEEKLAGKL